MSDNLFDKLKSYAGGGTYPMHMPGHKRNTSLLGNELPYDIDITEITGFDDLHNAHGVIDGIQRRLAHFYGAKKSFLLVNGSTCGIMAAVVSLCSFGDKIIAARNCHKSVYKAIELYGLTPVWLYPDTDLRTGICGAITAQSVEEAIKNDPDAKMVIVTSPTYEGIISDIRAISKVCGKYSVPLLCDMAHGAHLPLFEGYDTAFGADIEVTSLHKTLPCLTQTSCANIRSDSIDCGRFASALGMFESSSPSYVLMASADRCAELIMSKGKELAEAHMKRIESFEKSVVGMTKLRLLRCKGSDRSRIVIDCADTNICGAELFALLRDKYSIECEMASARYIAAITSICDTDDGVARFAKALCDTDAALVYRQADDIPVSERAETVLTAYNAVRGKKRFEDTDRSVGAVCGEYIWAYPPGIPIAVPGERITQNTVRLIKHMRNSGLNVISESKDKITVIDI